MIRGLRTVIYAVDDLEAATAWYEKLLGKTPYFNQPFYVGFNVGGFELGLQPLEGRAVVRGDSVVTYWGVDDVDAFIAVALAAGASAGQAAEDVGDGIRVGSVKDPWGNVFGVIQNPHFRFDEPAK